LQQLAKRASEGALRRDVQLDVWAHSVPLEMSDTWSAAPPHRGTEVRELAEQIKTFFKALADLGHGIPECLSWIANVTSVVVPYRARGIGSLRSGCRRSVPGLVRLDLHAGRLPIFEALVHESAHRYVFLIEAAAPLVFGEDP